MCFKFPSASLWESMASTTVAVCQERILVRKPGLGRTLGGHNYNIDLRFRFLVRAPWEDKTYGLKRPYRDAWIVSADPLEYLAVGIIVHIFAREIRSLQRWSGRRICHR